MALSELGDAGRLDQLRGLRDRLAVQIDECESARDVAALSQRYMDVLEQIAAVEKTQPDTGGTPVDEFSRRLAEKQASAGTKVAPRRRQSR